MKNKSIIFHTIRTFRFLKFNSFPVILTLLVYLFCTVNQAMAQIDTTKTMLSKTYVITTAEGNEFLGTISYQDEKEVVIETKTMGKVSIPKYQIKEMKEVTGKEISSGGDYIPEQRFASRYFITTNGLPLTKGDNYILWNIYGPDIQFSITDHFGIGIMTYNLFIAQRLLTMPEDWKNKTIKSIRWLLVEMAGKLIEHGRMTILKLVSGVEKYMVCLEMRRRTYELLRE